MSDRIKTLYGQLVRNGYDLGGYEKFNAAMHDSNRRRSLYNQLVANRADLGGYEKFSSVVETAPRTAPSAPQKKSDFVADTINMLRTPSSQYTRPQPSKAAGTFEMPSKYDIYHNMPDAVKRHQTPTPLKPEAVMPSVPSNAAESVWAAADKAESADVREKVDEGWSWRKIMQALSSGASVTGGLGDDNAQALETTSVAHLKTHDLQKLSDQAWAALGTKQQQSIINDTYRYLKEQYPDADDKALVDAARKMARAKSDEQMYNLAVEKNMPKSVGEFFLRKAAAASSFGSLSKGYASMMAGTRGDMEAEDTALQKYGSKHKVADIAGSVAGFAVDPLTYAAGGVGGAATKVALWTGGKVLSEAAARKMSQTLGGKLLLGAIGGAANFGTFEAGGEALNQYKWGGTLDVDPETGRYVVGDFSLGKVASQLRHGLAMGGLTGAFGTWLGNVSTRAAQATSSTLGKLGVRTGELGVGLVGEGTIFATPEFISTYGDYNDVIKSVSDKNSPNYIADDKERSKYIAEIKAQRGERMMDIWQDNLAMIAGFKAQHAIKSAGRTISELAASRRGKVGFVERMGRMLDGHPSLALSKEEQTELDKHGYGDLTQMVKEYKAYAQKDGDLPYNKITQLLNDKNVSEAARAKMYYYVTGHSLPMSAVIASNVIDNGDKTYTVQSLGDNGVITSRTYGSRKRADYEKSRIDRQAELNGVAMAEQMFDNMDRAERLKAVCTRLAQDKGVSPETLLWLTRKDPKQMTAAEKRWVKEIEDAANEDAPQGENATVRHIKGVIFDEYGVDVDKALRKAADSRTEAEKSAISAYNNELAQAVAERKNAISQGETTDAYRRGYEADTQGMRDAYVAQMYEPSEDNAETLKGVETQITESAKYQAALERDELKQMTHKDGSTHLATLKDKDKDGNGKQVYIVDGDIVMKEDGSGIDADASSKSVIIYDPATGEKKMVSPTAVDGIESLGEVKTAEQTEAEINARMQDTIQRGKDWLEGNVANPVGMQIQLGDGRIATIEAMHEDGKSAIATLPDGTQFLVPKDVLQRIVNNGQYADYKARRDAEASKREAEQSTESASETATEGGQPLPEEASPKEEESREYAQGDEFDVVVDGQKMHAEIVSPKDADGRFVVNVDDGESMRTLYVTPEELAAMEYREEPSPKVEETRLATEDSSEKALERGAQLTEEHAPTALERIPRDEKGNAQFHDVDTETAWDGLVEMSGNEETAHKVAEASLANAERKLKAAKALKEKGETPEELLRSIKENEAAVAEAQRVVDAWKAIVGEKSRREEAAKAEAERIATEKAEAERKAAEERERAEAEEEARVEAERKAEEERKTEEKERKAKTDGDGQNGFNFFTGTINELIAATRKKGSSLIKKVLSAASNRLIADLKDKGVDISPEYNHTIDNNAINHALNRHSSDKEKEQGQIPLTEKDIENVNDVIDNYDEIKTEKNSRGQDIIIYKKRYTDGTTLYVEEVRTGRKELAMASMRKQRSRKLTDADDLKSTPSSDLPSASADKGSEKPEKKQEKQSVFDKAKEIADKEEKKRKAEAEDDSALGQATRAVGKKKKVNLFKYTASKIISHPALRGVHYANGYAYASDGYILFKEKADYPKEWEGTTRDKDGNLIDGKYPDTEKAIHRLVHIPDKEVESLPSKEVLDFAIAASKKLKGEAIPVAIDGLFFNAVNLKKFLEAVASKGMDKVVYRHPMLYATNGKDEIIMMPTVNTLEGALDIADKMESAGLPKEQIDAWKAHIEAADKKKSFDDFKKAVENAKKEGVRPTEADKQESKAEAEKQKVDKQGNPIDAEGRLITEKVEDISDLSDDDFNNPTRSVELPKIPKNVDDALGANGRPVIIKKNIFEKNGKSHGFTPKQSRKILGDALYNPDIVGQSQPSTKKTHWVAIKVDEKSPITILEVNDGKDNVEVVGWYTLDARNLERIKRQAEREGGELLVLSPKDKVESLPTPTSGLPTDKGSEVGGEKQEAEKKRPAPIAERIEDVGEKIGDARKDVWKEIIARVKNKKQGIEEALKKSSAGKLFSSLFDEKELLESGVSNEVVTFISAVKGSLGTKPRSLSKLKMWINKVLHQYDMCEQALENWESVKKKIDEWKYYSQPFYMYRAAMAVGGYESGRDVGNAELWQIADGYSDGKSVAGQWCVRKAGAYDGIYKTYEEAAEALKKFAGENAAVDGKGKRKEVKLAIYKRRTDGTMFIAPEGKPDVIIQDGFKTLYEASAYKKEHYAEMQERYRTLMDGIKPKFNENRERKGRDWRGGKDVSAEDFREAFDFRGVEFGNWMQQKDRRQALNECYDSLMDLAMVCGVSPKALSLGGKLAMAFGARGVGKFNAHYEPDKVVINLTKTKGAGSLAHEWFHAIDNYFNMQGWDEFATESTRNVERKEMAEAWKDLVRAINGSDYFKRSDKYARLKGSRYWIEPTELGARAFAVWVENRLSKYGTINDYLANNPRLVDEKASDAEKKYAPYPFDKDADWMDEKFGRLFEVMQERVDEETGKHILYSRNKAAGHEKTELTAEERELRDNLVERMRKGGLDVVTDSEEMQRVIDTENERTRMMGAGSVREHRVYHGSGADFDAFDHSHMGEGEGAQAYGWGTYVTEVEGIGRTYAIQNTTKHNDALRALQHDVDAISDQLNRHRDDLKYDEEQLKRANEWRAEAELDYELFKDEAEELKEKYGESSPEYRNHLFNDIYTDEMKRAQSSVKSTEESIQYRKEKIAELEKALKDKQAEIDELPKEFPRHLYTVEIPDDNGSNYLDWNGHPAESLLKDVGSFLESEGFERVQDSPVRYEKGESTVVLNPNATGADLYAELREALGSDKKASQALAELGCIGIKYPADNMRGGRKDGAKNYVIFNENDAKITDHTRFLRTADGEVYGLVKDGRIYLDPKVATAETAVHEYTHLWGDMLRRKDSEQWSHTVKELKDSVLWEEVKELYPELKTDDEIADEVLSTFSGRRGAERLREEARRVADGEGGVFTKAKAIETLERVKEAIAWFWEGVARMFGINRYRSAEELADMAMRDLINGVKPTSRTFTFDNFYKDTKAVFEGTERPKGKPDYTSYSGSEYWYGEDKGGKYVVRGSDHWSGEFKVKDGERTNVGRNHYSEITEDGMLPIGAQGSLKFGWEKGLSKPVGSGISAAIDRRGSGDSNNIASCYWYIDNAKGKDNKGFTYGKAYLSEFEDKERRRDIPGDDWRDIQGLEGGTRAMRSEAAATPLKGDEALTALDSIFGENEGSAIPPKISSFAKFKNLFKKPVRTFLGELVQVKDEVWNKILRNNRQDITGTVLPTIENADFAIRDTDGSTLYVKRFKGDGQERMYNVVVVNKHGEVEDYISSVHIKRDNNLRNKIKKGAELFLPNARTTDGTISRNNSTPGAKVANYSETAKPRFSRKPGESIFDYASRVSDSVDRSVRERVSARDEYEKKVKSKGFQTKEALQNSMLGLQEFMFAIDHASGNKRYIEDIPDFENPILGENRLSSVNKEEMHQVAKTQFKPLMSAVAKLSGNGKESGELYDYMFAKHGLERDAVMRQREAQKDFDKYQKANPKGTKTIGDFVASLEGKDYAGLTALTAEDGRVKSIQSQIDAIDEQMEVTDNQLLLHYLGGQKKRLKVDLLNAARDAADDIRKTFENNPSHDRSDINELWSRVNEVNGNTLRKLYESGMLTKEAYNDISSMYTNYIPMRGFDQTTSADAYAYLTHGDSAFNAPIKTAKGRSSKADNPIAYMQAMAESAIMQGNRNVLVKQKMLNFVRNHPSDLASVSDVWLQYDSVADEWKPVFPDNIDANDSASVVAKKMEAFEDKMKQMAEKHPDLVMRSNEAPDIPYKVVEKGQLNEHQVLVKQNGKSYIITVNGSPRAAQAANGLTNPDTDLTGAVGKVFEGAEALNRQLSSLYTTLNPDFIGSNYVRDALYSNTMVYVKEGAKYGGSFNFNFAKYNPAEMANLYASYNKGSLDTSNETHRLFLEFMQNGGETGFVNLKQIEKRKSEIAKAIKRDGRISAAQIWGGLSDAVDFANRAVENSARFAAYVTSRRSGRSVGRSVYDAKEISVNFNRKGSGSKFMGAEGQTKAGNAAAFVSGAGRGLYIFWNAGLQGLTNFSRQIGRHPGRALTLASLLFGFGALMSYLGSNDDDDENNYFNLPKYIRRSNVCYKIGDLFVTIPLPVEYRAFYGLGELASSTLAGKESGTTKDIAKEAVSQISQLFPIDFMEGGGGLHALIPSAVKPIVEAETNTAWTGLPIYKDNDFNKNMPEYTKVYKTANGYLVEIARALNDATGGNKYKKGFIDINPAKMEYVLKGMLGGAFSFPDKLVKTTETILGDREFDWRNTPFANRFVKNADERTEYKALNEQYYKAKEEADIVRQQYNGAMKEIKAGNGSYKDLLGEVVRSDDFQKMVLFDAYNKPIKKLNDTLKQLRMSSDYDEKAEKVIREKIASVQRAMINKLEKMDSVNK